MRQSTREKTWNSQNFQKVKGGFHQPLGLKNSFLLWMTNRWSGLYEETLFKAQSHMSLCTSPNSDGAGNLHRRRPGKTKLLLSQGVSTISVIKKHHIKRKREDPVNSKKTIFPFELAKGEWSTSITHIQYYFTSTWWGPHPTSVLFSAEVTARKKWE